MTKRNWDYDQCKTTGIMSNEKLGLWPIRNLDYDQWETKLGLWPLGKWDYDQWETRIMTDEKLE